MITFIAVAAVIGLAPAVATPAHLLSNPTKKPGCRVVPRGFSCSRTTPIRFAYPVGWQTARFHFPPARVWPLIYLSTETLHDPCTTTTTENGIIQRRCSAPVG